MTGERTDPAGNTPPRPVRTKRLAALRRVVGAIPAWLRGKPVTGGLLAGSVAACLVGVSMLAALLLGSNCSADALAAARALEALDAGKFAAAKEVAVKLYQSRSASDEPIATAALVLGAALAHEAASQWNAEKRQRLYLIAAQYLDAARRGGFPPKRTAAGLYLLGTSLYGGGQFARSVPVLLAALDENPQKSGELHQLIARAYMQQEQPDYPQALAHLQKRLDDPALSAADRYEALLQKSRIYFRLGDTAQSREALEGIPLHCPLRAQATIMRARLLMLEADDLLAHRPAAGAVDARARAMGKLADSIKALELAKVQDPSAGPATSEADYLLGVCYQKMGDLPTSERYFAQTRRQNLDAPIGLAAALGQAEVQQRQGRHDEAIDSYLRVLDQAGSAKTFRNPWVSLAAFRRRIYHAYLAYWRAGLFEQAVQLARSLGPTFPRSESVRWQAEAHRAWAAWLTDQAPSLSPSRAAAVGQQARRQYRLAGRLFEQLAQMRIVSRRYPDYLWHSADSYLRGQNYHGAVRMLTQFMQYGSRNQIPRAQVALGKARLALNDLEQALDPLLACIQLSPNDPNTYEARLVASQVYLEMDQADRAQAMLVDNLENGSLTPESLEWRDSLLALGKLLHRQGAILEARSRQNGVDAPATAKKGLKDLEQSYRAYQQAIGKLDEFVQRYQDQPRRQLQLVEARYLMADAYRQAAKWPRKKLAGVTIATTRAALIRQMHKQLKAASEIYQALQADLQRRQDETELNDVERAILRNCYFGRADALFDMGQYQEAIQAYSSAANRYHDRPEALEAFVQIASCYRRLHRQAEARGTLQQAKVVLRRIDPKADFTRTSRYDRQRWGQLLDWLSTL